LRFDQGFALLAAEALKGTGEHEDLAGQLVTARLRAGQRRDAKLLELGAGTTNINLMMAARLELGIKPSAN
jgi:hypothetical protein